MPDNALTIQAKPSVETLDQRLKGMDEAVKLLQENANRMPTPALVMAEVKALKELTAVQFQSVREIMELQSKSFEKLVDARFEGNKTALDAALKERKEASDKLEVNFTKQFDNFGNLLTAKTDALGDKIDDTKVRIVSSEGRTKGLGQGWIVFVGVVSMLAAFSGIISVIVVLTKG